MPSAAHGAVGSLDAAFALFAVGIAPAPELGAAVGRALDRALTALAPWRSGRSYFNFAEREVDAARLYRPETYRRLRRVRAAYDPGELFLANHPIPALRSASGFDPDGPGPLRRGSELQ